MGPSQVWLRGWRSGGVGRGRGPLPSQNALATLGEMVFGLLDAVSRTLAAVDHIATINRPVDAATVAVGAFFATRRAPSKLLNAKVADQMGLRALLDGKPLFF